MSSLVERDSSASALGRALSAVLLMVPALALGAAVVLTPLPVEAQWMFGALVYLLALCLTRVSGRLVTLTLIGMSVLVSLRYFYFRVSSTLPQDWSLDLILSLLLLAAELYSLSMLLLGYMQTAWPLERRSAPLPEDTSSWPTVDVYIPSYNEPLHVVAPTVLAARALEWPSDKLRVYLLDDGARSEFREFAARTGVGYFARTDRSHAKAGNINAALSKTSGKFLVILDCDHVPARTLLQVALGWLVRDERLALVQLPHHFYSPDPFERNLATFRRQPNEGELFYGLIQPGNDLWNAAFFCGSAAAIRRDALLSVGGIAVETVTEDAHTALRLQRRGYHTAYLNSRQIGGLATESLSAHVRQRQRWARGMAQIWRQDNPFWGRGLTFAQRLCYAASMLYYFHAAPRLIFLLSPLSYLVLGAHIIDASPALVLAYAVPHLVQSTLTNSRLQGRVRHSFWSEVYETSLAPFILLPTTIALFAPKYGGFNVTSKGGKVLRTYFDRAIALPHLVLVALNVVGLALGALRLVQHAPNPDVTILNMCWVGYNLLMLGAVLRAAREVQQLRGVPRIDVDLPSSLRWAGARMVAATARNISVDGALVTVASADDCPEGDELHLCLLEPRVLAVPARVVRREGTRIRLRFENLSVDEMSALVEASFARKDLWSSWNHGLKSDRPWIEAMRIALHGVRGLGLGLWAPFARRNDA